MKRMVLLFCCLPFFSMAQQFMKEGNMTLTDINGKPIFPRSGYELDGSPFFRDDYCLAKIKVANGKTYEHLPVKLNLQENRVIFRQPDGSEMEAVTPIEYLEFTGCGPVDIPFFRSGYPAIDGQDASTYYQVLQQGNVQLLKLWRISYSDQRPYGSAMTVRKFERSPVYYAFLSGSGMVPLGKGNELALQLFPGRADEITRYASRQNLRLRREEDLKKLFVYLGSF